MKVKEVTITFYKKEGHFKPIDFLKSITNLTSNNEKPITSKISVKFNNEIFPMPEKYNKLKNYFLWGFKNQEAHKFKVIIEGEDEEEITNIVKKLKEISKKFGKILEILNKE